MRQLSLKKKQVGLAVSVFLLTFLVLQTVAFGYSIIWGSCNFSTNQYQLKKYYSKEGSHDYSSEIVDAINLWNWSGANINIYTYNSSDYNLKFTSDYFGSNGWYGKCSYPVPIIRPNKAYIKLNESYHNSIGSNMTELIAHEIGHALRLDDSSNSNVLMRESGFKGSPCPEWDDVCGVNSNYK